MNPMIALSGRPVRLEPPESRLNALAKIVQLGSAMDQGDLSALKIQEARSGIADKNALNVAYKDALGPDGVVDRNKLYSRIPGSMIPGLQKQFAEADKATADLGKTKSETGKIDLDMSLKRAEHVASVLSLAKDPQSYEMVRRTLAATFPQAAAGLPEQFDPGFVQAQIAQGMTIVQKLTDQRAREQQAETARHNKSSEGIQIRGQNMVDSRARQTAEATLTKPFEVTGADGNPVLVQQDKQGNIRPVQGYSPKAVPLKDIPPTVNAAIIQNKQSADQIDRALTLLSGTDIGKPGEGGQSGDKNATGWKGYLPNTVLNRIDPSGVDARAEISDIGSLKIHDRSGAAVTLSESPRLMPFIPLATDDAATVKKKLSRLRTELANESAALSETYSKAQGYKPSPVKVAAPAAAPTAPKATNAKGWMLHTDAQGNKAYVSPDGKSFEEVK